MKISLLIATRNRAQALSGLLRALSGLAPVQGGWELLVVDNGSTDGTARLLEGARAAFPITRVHEPAPGKSRALNRGLGQARGEILVFTDDDVAPEPGWLVELTAAAERHPDCTVLGGPVRVDPAGIPGWILGSANLQEMLLSDHQLGETEGTYPPCRYPIGPNMAVRRVALEASGARWPLDLGPGTPVPLGDERGFLNQLSSCDACDRLYVPTAVVAHAPELDQLTFPRALRRCWLGGYAAGRVQRRFPRGAAESLGSSLALAGRRAGAWRSAREVACVLARAAGVTLGRTRRA